MTIRFDLTALKPKRRAAVRAAIDSARYESTEMMVRQMNLSIKYAEAGLLAVLSERPPSSQPLFEEEDQ